MIWYLLLVRSPRTLFQFHISLQSDGIAVTVSLSPPLEIADGQAATICRPFSLSTLSGLGLLPRCCFNWSLHIHLEPSSTGMKCPNWCWLPLHTFTTLAWNLFVPMICRRRRRRHGDRPMAGPTAMAYNKKLHYGTSTTCEVDVSTPAIARNW